MSAIKGYVYRLQVRGVFGRNRTVKFHSTKLLPFDANVREEAEVRAAAEVALKQLGLKSGSYLVTEDPIERECRDDGIVWERFMLFSERKVMEGSF
jgi:hypothetical protein